MCENSSAIACAPAVLPEATAVVWSVSHGFDKAIIGPVMHMIATANAKLATQKAIAITRMRFSSNSAIWSLSTTYSARTCCNCSDNFKDGYAPVHAYLNRTSILDV